jgi:hypothetical protein
MAAGAADTRRGLEGRLRGGHAALVVGNRAVPPEAEDVLRHARSPPVLYLVVVAEDLHARQALPVVQLACRQHPHQGALSPLLPAENRHPDPLMRPRQAPGRNFCSLKPNVGDPSARHPAKSSDLHQTGSHPSGHDPQGLNGGAQLHVREAFGEPVVPNTNQIEGHALRTFVESPVQLCGQVQESLFRGPTKVKLVLDVALFHLRLEMRSRFEGGRRGKQARHHTAASGTVIGSGLVIAAGSNPRARDGGTLASRTASARVIVGFVWCRGAMDCCHGCCHSGDPRANDFYFACFGGKASKVHWADDPTLCHVIVEPLFFFSMFLVVQSD